MSLTAPIKPSPPTVPQVKMQPVESDSQNTAKPQSSAQVQQPNEKKTSEKPAISAKTEPAANNTTVINKVEANDQNKVPLLNGTEGTGNTSANTTVADKAPPAQNKFSSIDIYASVICSILFVGIVLYFLWRRKNMFVKPKQQQPRRSAPRQSSGAKMPRTVIDYSTNNTKEIVDMLTSSADVQPDNTKLKGKIKKEVTSNFEFRI